MKPADAVRLLQSRPRSLSDVSSHLRFDLIATKRRRKKRAIAPDDFLHQLKRVPLANKKVITGYLTLSAKGDDQHRHVYEGHWESALEELRELGAALKVVGPAVGLFTEGLDSLPDIDFFVLQLHHAQDENARLLMGKVPLGKREITSYIPDLALECLAYLSRLSLNLSDLGYRANSSKTKQANNSSKGASRSAASDDKEDPFDEKYLRILRVLRDKRCTSNEARMPLDNIAKQIDPHNNKTLVQKQSPWLAKNGYIDTLTCRPKKGHSGGCFITPKGLAHLQKSEKKGRVKRGLLS